jgi:ATP-binding cassette subfamily F protein 2
MSKRYNEKRSRLAEAAIEKELDSGYGQTDFETVAAKDVRGAAMGQGEQELFEKKLSKAEKKAAAKAAKDAKKKKKAIGKSESTDDVKQFDEEEDEVDQAEDVPSGAPVTSIKAPIVLGGNATAEQKRDAALEQLSNENIIVTYEAKKGLLHANTRDINVSGVTVTFHGKPLIEETDLVINYGNRYGFMLVFLCLKN